MDMKIFQIESNKIIPKQGRILISSPFLNDYHFSRSVILLIEHDEQNSMGIVMNKNFKYSITLNDLFPVIDSHYKIPVYKGGPVSRDTLFFIHTLKNIKGSLPLGNGMYLNGNFEDVLEYIKKDNPIDGIIKFFAGYAGWDNTQLDKEINQNSWIVGLSNNYLLGNNYENLWNISLNSLGGKYSIWAKYPRFPYLN